MWLWLIPFADNRCFPFRHIQGYSANVKALHGKHFALHSAQLAADLVARQLSGQAVDWQQEFANPLMVGINAFRTYVNGWYDCSFQDVIYARNPQPEIRQMISSILAGYAWDEQNPFVAKSEQRLKALAELCGEAEQD